MAIEMFPRPSASDWRANPGFTLDQLTERWEARMGKLPRWKFWLRGSVYDPVYWARIQYDQMMNEVEAMRRHDYSDLIGAYWLR